MELKCIICGKELKATDVGKEWRSCYFCKKAVCFNDIHYLGIWREGLYDKYVEVVPICSHCKPKKPK